MTPTPGTCVVYCRTSTQGQKDAETIGAQIERCHRIIERHKLAPMKYGPKRDGWVIDDGVSGSLLEGRAFSKFVDDLEASRIRPDYLVVFSLSRISRLDKSSREMAKLVKSHTDNARIKAVLLGSRVRVLDEEGENDPSSVMFDLKLTLSTEEYKLIRARTMAGKARRFAEGAFAKGGHPPYGYMQVPRNGVDKKAGYTLAPHPEHAKHLTRILAWFVAGGVTHAAREATAAGIPTPMAGTAKRKNQAADWTPTRWSPVSVQHIVRNAKAYLGESTYVYDDQPATITYPPLIDLATYDRVVKRSREKTLKRRDVKLTTGFVDCGCGEHLHCKLSTAAKRHYTKCPAGHGSMREAEFSAYLFAAVVFRLVQIQMHERAETGASTAIDAQIEGARAKLERVQASINKLLDLYMADSGLDKPTWRARNEVYTNEKRALEAELSRLIGEKAENEQRKAGESTVEKQIEGTFRELSHGAPSLERRRQILSDILQGQRVTATWGKATKRGKAAGTSAYATITLPAFGSLKPMAVRTDRPLRDQFFGATLRAIPRGKKAIGIEGVLAAYNIDTSTAGQGRDAAEQAHRERVAAAGGTVTSRKGLPGGDVEIEIEIPDPPNVHRTR